jgi:hypothetical protein
MPCYDPPSRNEQAESARRYKESITGPLHEAIVDLHKEIDTLKAELAERDAMLCGVLTALARADGARWHDADDLIIIPGEAVQEWYDEEETGVSYDAVLEWFQEHQRRDAERLAREAAELEARKAQALKKLTPEERVLLGLAGKLGD